MCCVREGETEIAQPCGRALCASDGQPPKMGWLTRPALAEPPLGLAANMALASAAAAASVAIVACSDDIVALFPAAVAFWVAVVTAAAASCDAVTAVPDAATASFLALSVASRYCAVRFLLS